jgi:4-alpha-glucanotransferase
MPIYMVHDSVDVWMNPEIFNLDPITGQPLTLAGVPPDYFSKTGQLWGNPVYRWDALKKTGYGWWIRRIAHNLKLFDLLRLDHFRGFAGYWEVPAEEKDAVNGRWVTGPGMEFFSELAKRLPSLPFVAEDLGIITPDVWTLMEQFRLPGMKVLLFAFGPDLRRICTPPTTTLQNPWSIPALMTTTRCAGGSKAKLLRRTEIGLLATWTGTSHQQNVHREMIRLAMMSVARIAVLPMQDILGLGEEARMNRPASNHGNWKWRLDPQRHDPGCEQRSL